MKKLFSLAATALLSITLFAQTTWKADPMHSKLTFSVTHLGISDVAGLFKTFEATAVVSRFQRCRFYAFRRGGVR